MTSASNAALVAAYKSDLLQSYSVYATAALVSYEHLITYKYEPVFWHKKSAGTWIFVSNRYLLLAYVISTAAPSSPPLCANALAVNFLAFLTVEMQNVPLHAFTVMRCLALMQTRFQKLAVSTVLVALALMLVIADSYVGFTETWVYVDDPILGSSCFFNGYSVSANIIQQVSTASALCGIVSAAVALVITLHKTARQVWQANSLRFATTLSEVLLRDGSLFFLLILLTDILSIIPATNTVLFTGPIGTVLSELLEVLPKILLSRFIINLRQVDLSSSLSSNNHHLSRFSIPNFRIPTLDEVIDNLGEQMDFVEYCIDDEESRDGEHARAEDACAEVDIAPERTGGPSGTTHADVEQTEPSVSDSQSSSNIDILGAIRGESASEGFRLDPTLSVR